MNSGHGLVSEGQIDPWFCQPGHHPAEEKGEGRGEKNGAGLRMCLGC